MLLGGVLQSTAKRRSQIIVGRILSGIGLGHINSMVPVLQVRSYFIRMFITR